MKYVRVLDAIIVGCLMGIGFLYPSRGALMAHDLNPAFLLMGIALAVGVARIAIVYNDFKKRGL